ncbi:ATP-binding protein, partial [Kitasatospora nipponensis]
MSTENRIDGGHFNGDVFMAEHITQILPGRPHPALSGMPRHSPTFTGRETQLDQILAVLRPEETAATVVVTGLAGMGKTELV